jgi:hypothetical protein
VRTDRWTGVIHRSDEQHFVSMVEALSLNRVQYHGATVGFSDFAIGAGWIRTQEVFRLPLFHDMPEKLIGYGRISGDGTKQDKDQRPTAGVHRVAP